MTPKQKRLNTWCLPLVLLKLLATHALANVPDEQLEADMFEQTRHSSVQFRLAPSLGVLSTSLGTLTAVGGVAGISFSTSPTFEMGLEAGYLTAGINDAVGLNSDSGISANLTMVPILFTTLYRFSRGVVRPYIGAAVGVSISSVSVGLSGSSSTSYGSNYGSNYGSRYSKRSNYYDYDSEVRDTSTEDDPSATVSEVELVLQARPGVEFALGQNFAIYAEPRIGVVGSKFVFLPQVGLTVGL